MPSDYSSGNSVNMSSFSETRNIKVVNGHAGKLPVQLGRNKPSLNWKPEDDDD